MGAREMRALGVALKAEAESAATMADHVELLHLTGDAYLAAAAKIEFEDKLIPGALVALSSILSLIGNVDHSKGHGPNAAAMRGDMLNDIRDIATKALRP